MFSQKKPYSSVTVLVEKLTSDNYVVDDLSGVPDLVEVIALQTTGPKEAARAIRKKLKYGSVHLQLRALVLLDGLIQNAGPRFQRTFADEPLLERLRVCATSHLSDPRVLAKCADLFRAWAKFANTPGMDRVARLYKELPKLKAVFTQEASRAVKESENPFDDDDGEAGEQAQTSPAAAPSSPPSSPPSLLSSSASPHVQAKPAQSPWRQRSSSFFSRDKKKPGGASAGKADAAAASRRRPTARLFNLAAEKESMRTAIADATMAATGLINALQSINREQERISHNKLALERFETCKQLRRRVLRYIYHVQDEHWLGTLLHANDELVKALMTFEQLDRSIDADSDSEDELAEQAHKLKMASLRDQNPSLSKSSLSIGLSNVGRTPPPRPSTASKPSHRPAPPPPMPPRPTQVAVTGEVSDPDGAGGGEMDDAGDDDAEDPFADHNAFLAP